MAALPNDSTHAFDANGYTLEQFQQDCAAQLSRAQVPPPYWRSIYDKLRFQVFDAGHSFGFSPISEDDVTGPMSLAAAVELHKDDPTNVWIVDHAWTFTVATAATSLRNDEQLRRRVSAMLIGDSAATMHASYVEWIIQETLDNLWKRARNYTIDGVHGASTVWYLADEVGTAVLPTTSTEDANVAFAALYFPPLQTAFDVMWLTQDVGEGEMVMFDVTRGVSQQYRHFHPKFALVWAGGEEEEEIQGICLAKYLMHLDVVKERNAVAAGRLEMVAAGGTHADLVAAATAPPRPELKGGTVFCDDVAMRRHLERGDKYVFTESMGDATIVWLRRAVRGSSLSALAPTATFVSQFNNEVELTHEARRSRCVHQQLGEPAWQPLVFPANEIDLFVGHLQHASQVAQETLLRRSAQAAAEVPPAKGPLKPAWCVRPSGRGVSFATTSMDLLLRSGEERNDDPESEAGPGCFSEFVRSCDTLSDGRKYSLQFFVLVHSFAPLKAFVVNRYWLRVAQQPLSHDTDECDMLDEAVHITRTRLNMHPEDFEASFNERHGEGRWQATLGDCHQALFELFAAVDLQVGKSMAVRGNFAGTVYRAEVIMAASATAVTPRIVSIDACPDMTRQNDDDPRFFGTLFDALFCCGDADPSFATRLTHCAVASQHRVGGDAVTHVD